MPKQGTIMCVVCGRPAIGKGYDGLPYCRVHMMEKYGYLIPVGAV